MVAKANAIADKRSALSRFQIALLSTSLLAYYLLSQIFLKQSHFMDDIFYDIGIRRLYPDTLLFPHHPAFHLLQIALWKPISLLFPALTPYDVTQQVNLLLGIACGLLIFIIVWKWTAKFCAAFSAMLLFLLPYASWFFFMGGEPYTAGIFFTLLLYYYILFILPVRERTSSYIFLGLLSAMMILLHNFTAPALAAAVIYLLRQSSRKKTSYWRPLCLLGTAIAVLALFYISAGAFLGQLSSPAQFFRWLTFYAQMGIWGKLTPLTVSHSLLGLWRALYFGSYVRDFLAFRVFQWFTPLFLALFAAIAGGFIYLAVLIARKFSDAGLWRANPGMLLLLTSLFISTAMIIVWNPPDPDFWEFALAPFAILCGLAIAQLTPGLGRRLVYGLIGALLVANFAGEIYPNSRFAGYQPATVDLAQALLQGGAESRDVLISGLQGADWEMCYQTGGKTVPRWLSLEIMFNEQGSWEGSSAYLEECLRQVWLEGGKVWVTEDEITLYDPIVDYPFRHHSYHLEPFLAQYGTFLNDTGYTFWLHGQKTRIFQLDVEQYFGDNE
jgi:hypothetical protein